MKRSTQGVLLLIAGVVALRLVWTGTYLDYVKDRMVVPLAATGLVLAGLGLATVLVGAFRGGDEDDEHDEVVEADEAGDADHHHHGPRVAWLLVLPLVAILLIAPRALGADAASRQADSSTVRITDEFPPIFDPVDGHVPMEISAFLSRAHYDESGSLEALPVRLTGFVTHDAERVPDGFLLTRFSISCCAADAQVLQVAVPGQGMPPEDTWVAVEGTLRPDPLLQQATDDLPLAFLDATSVEEIEPPENPYE